MHVPTGNPFSSTTASLLLLRLVSLTPSQLQEYFFARELAAELVDGCLQVSDLFSSNECERLLAASEEYGYGYTGLVIP